uniref:Protein FAM32A n=2 Tax=Fusarium oxysporum TaxID=5507 RepID=A0A0D2XV31_FUSOF
MGSNDYAAVGGGGALKLKGAKIHKKKKKRDKTDLEKNLDTGNKDEEKRRKKDREEQEPHDEDDEDKPEVQKTEAQKRHEEIKKKRLLKLAESSSSRPELLKTHKERVEELNTYLSRLSEHHDMPRIGPG